MRDVSKRAWIWAYHLAGRLWLTAAGLALLLPETTRHGLWLPLHLALAGAVGVSISGNLLNFVGSLSAGPDPSRPAVWTQFALVNAGAAMVAAGMTWSVEPLTAAGGVTYVASVVLLAAMARRTWRKGLNKRHRLPVLLYGAALAAVVAGAAIGAVLGSGAVDDPALYVGLRGAHMTLNVLGFASLTIAATLVTLLPTVLRVRMPAWQGGVTGALLAAGVAVQATGLAADVAWVAAAGAIVFAAGVAGLVSMALRVLSTPRRWPVPVAAKHLVAGLGWLAAGSVAQAVVLVTGSFADLREVFLLTFVGGFVLQTLLGSWLFMLPMQRPGHPEERRHALAAVELGGNAEVALLNAGIVALVLWTATDGSSVLGRAGAAMALFGAAVALAKAWTYPALARLPVARRRSAELWAPRT
jgi:nitrite reductase (NO-forming)